MTTGSHSLGHAGDRSVRAGQPQEYQVNLKGLGA
jgi:hypothetical protein